MKRKYKYNWTVVWDYGTSVYYKHFISELNAYKFLVNLLSKKPGIYEPDGYLVTKRSEFEKERINNVLYYERVIMKEAKIL